MWPSLGSMKPHQIIKLSILLFSLSAHSILLSQDSNARPMGGYFNVGLLGDFALRGYTSSAVDRDPRLGYQVEIGNQYFALPLSFSNGQSVQIFGVKPRGQFLIPFVEGLFMAGPGVGLVYNYWHSSFNLLGDNITTNSSELGAQLSVQVMIRPLPWMHVLITPAAYDFNFWRHVSVGDSKSGLGNFSTTDSALGVIYTASGSVGFNF